MSLVLLLLGLLIASWRALSLAALKLSFPSVASAKRLSLLLCCWLLEATRFVIDPEGVRGVWSDDDTPDWWVWLFLALSLVVTVTRGTVLLVPPLGSEGGRIVEEEGEGVLVIPCDKRIGESVPELSLSVWLFFEDPRRDNCQRGFLLCLGVVIGLFSTLLLLFFSDLILTASCSWGAGCIQNSVQFEITT